MVFQNEAPTHQVGQTVTVWLSADRIYVGTVTAVHPERLTVHLPNETARIRVSPSLAF